MRTCSGPAPAREQADSPGGLPRHLRGDIVIRICHEEAALFLIQVYVPLRVDVFLHGQVLVQMVRREVCNNGDVRRPAHSEKLKRAQLHNGHVLRRHLSGFAQKRRTYVPAHVDSRLPVALSISDMIVVVVVLPSPLVTAYMGQGTLQNASISEVSTARPVRRVLCPPVGPTRPGSGKSRPLRQRPDSAPQTGGSAGLHKRFRFFSRRSFLSCARNYRAVFEKLPREGRLLTPTPITVARFPLYERKYESIFIAPAFSYHQRPLRCAGDILTAAVPDHR